MEVIFIIIGAVVGAVIVFFVKPNKTDDGVIEEAKQKALRDAEESFETRKQELITSLRQEYDEETNRKIAQTEKAYEGQIQDYQAQLSSLQSDSDNTDEVINLQNTIEQLQVRINELELQLASSMGGDDSGRLAELEQQLAQKDQEYLDRQAQLQESFQIQIEQLQASHQSQIQDYETQIANLREAFANINTTPEEDNFSSPEFAEATTIMEVEEELEEETPSFDEGLDFSSEEETPSLELEEETSSFDEGLDFGSEEETPSLELEEETSSFDEGLDFGSEEETPSLELEEETSSFDEGLDFSSEEETSSFDEGLDFGSEEEETPSFDSGLGLEDEELNLDALAESDITADSDVEIFNDSIELESDDLGDNFNLDAFAESTAESEVEMFSEGLDFSGDNELEEISSDDEEFNFDAFSESASASASVESDVEMFGEELDLSESDNSDDDFNFDLDLSDNSEDDNELDLSALVDDDSNDDNFNLDSFDNTQDEELDFNALLEDDK
ncbi:hypothetical protein ACN4EE_19640 [Geminocystis sp. CENA526]|uniref:hypothetical protein n=1 Tax=Geminocystis sp. CENA526 TaxID=1355871 RepID=UPI003D6F9D60